MFKEENYGLEKAKQNNQPDNRKEGELFNRHNCFSAINEYYPWSSGLTIGEISSRLKEDYNFNPNALEKELDIILFDSLWWGSAEKAKPVMALIVEIYGAETAREKINKAINETPLPKTNDLNQSKFLSDEIKTRSLITPNHDKIAIENLQKFYNEKIKFEDYEINKKMNEKEVALLQDLIDKNEKALEMGCGTGRLFLEMKKAGYDISGIDFAPRHIEFIKQQSPDAKVFVADWHNTELPGESYTIVYSLGRNILHDYSFVDQTQTFREASRLLKTGGKFIFDIPNREKGGYKLLVEEYASEMKKRGIRNFRYGSIYDSPNEEDFATRYAYSNEDISFLAQVAGFKIVEVKKAALETGKGDENLYYVLEKM